MVTLRVQRAHRHRVPIAADCVLEFGQEVLLWREKVVENCIGEWIGLFPILAFDRA